MISKINKEQHLDKNKNVLLIEKQIKKKKYRKNVVNVFCTEYDIVLKTAKKVLEARLKFYEEDHEGAVINGEGGKKLS